MGEVISYTLPKLHKSKKSWYVDFKAFDPATGGLKRKKFMLDSIKKVSARQERAAEIIANVTARLRRGWTPWADVQDRRGYAQLQDVLEIMARPLDWAPGLPLRGAGFCAEYYQKD